MVYLMTGQDPKRFPSSPTNAKPSTDAFSPIPVLLPPIGSHTPRLLGQAQLSPRFRQQQQQQPAQIGDEARTPARLASQPQQVADVPVAGAAASPFSGGSGFLSGARFKHNVDQIVREVNDTYAAHYNAFIAAQPQPHDENAGGGVTQQQQQQPYETQEQQQPQRLQNKSSARKGLLHPWELVHAPMYVEK